MTTATLHADPGSVSITGVDADLRATPTVDAVLARVQQQLAALGDAGDVLNTVNAQEKYWHDRSGLEGLVRTIRTSADTLATVEPQIAADSEWLANLNTWRLQLCTELLDMPPHDKRQQNWRLSIQTVDRGRRVTDDTGYMLETIRLGELMRAAGYRAAPPIENQVVGIGPWFGCIPEVEHRLRELRAQRDDAAYRLAAALREAESVSS